MNTTMADGAAQRLVEQIGEALFGQPGLNLMELAEKVKAMKSGQADSRTRFEAWADGADLSTARFNDGGYCDERTVSSWLAWIAAQPSPAGQGNEPWPEIDLILADAYSAGAEGLQFEGIARRAAVRAAVAALDARQPVAAAVKDSLTVGGGQEPVEHDCTNCDRKHVEVICPTCAGIAWDNGRLHEFYEVRELSTSLGEGVLDHLLPDEWHEKPLLRFQGEYDAGDSSVGIGGRSGNVLAADQSGTVLGDYLAARAAKEGGQ